ncbi:MAG: undecaprenyldiphospho-muramoylpentapeptide beta-N-acetylglucosaminyltransferase [Myxococcota bacterium]|nr:undecaprenyldiphospho-muramoylpentapeptide beta-N-acetylglucosaminyltransferase [Myxococcota bacterium]
MTQSSVAGTVRRLAIVGGGTGGHVYPGVAVAEAWLTHVDEGDVIFVGSAQGMEARITTQLGYAFEGIQARRLKNAGVAERLRSLLSMPMAIWQGFQLVKRLQPDVVLGVGGYVSGPVVLAAALGGWPCAIAEQNARPGLTNRILAKFVQRIYTAFPEVSERLPPSKIRQLGNPVRTAFTQSSDVKQDDQIHILVLGGSQGAKALNERLPAVFAGLNALHSNLDIVHQTGRDRDEPVRAAYDALGVHNVRVQPFIDRMADVLDQADLVIARAGATTVAELACMGRPAIFIPFPYAADDHQAANAESLVTAGAAKMVREENMTTDGMIELIDNLLSEPSRLAEMSVCAKTRGRPDAARSIVSDLLRLSGLTEKDPETTGVQP